MKQLALYSVVIVSGIFLTILILSQTSLRMSANNAQIQRAQEVTSLLQSGSNPIAVVGKRVDMRTSYSPFVNIYDAKGRVLAGEGYIDGHVANFPLGALKAAGGKAYYTVTWQPDPGLRMDAVVQKLDDKYTVAAQSIKIVEKQKAVESLLIILGWLATVAVIGLVYIFESKTFIKKKAQH